MDVQSKLGKASKAITADVVRSLWEAGRLIEGCGNKVRLFLDGMTRQARQAVNGAAVDVEASLSGMVAAAWEMARPFGCEMPTAAEIALAVSESGGTLGVGPDLPTRLPVMDAAPPLIFDDDEAPPLGSKELPRCGLPDGLCGGPLEPPGGVPPAGLGPCEEEGGGRGGVAPLPVPPVVIVRPPVVPPGGSTGVGFGGRPGTGGGPPGGTVGGGGRPGGGGATGDSPGDRTGTPGGGVLPPPPVAPPPPPTGGTGAGGRPPVATGPGDADVPCPPVCDAWDRIALSLEMLAGQRPAPAEECPSGSVEETDFGAAPTGLAARPRVDVLGEGDERLPPAAPPPPGRPAPSCRVEVAAEANAAPPQWRAFIDTDDVCKAVDQLREGHKEFWAKIFGSPNWAWLFSRDGFLQTIRDVETRAERHWLAHIYRPLWEALHWVGKAADTLVPFLLETLTDPNWQIRIARTIVRAAHAASGGAFPDVVKRTDYLINADQPYQIPEQGQLDLAWLMGLINQTDWDCLTRMNGNLPNWAGKVRDAQRRQPTPHEWVMVHLRGLLTDGQLDTALREVGVTTPTERSYFKELAKWVPPASDLVRFMVRDVFDEEVVKRFDYDQAFGEKFTGKAKDWAKAQGMTDEQFRFYWRAHWRLPSPTQAYEMLHRLRPGRVAAGLVTTREDVRKLLEIDDVAPFWQERMVEISFSVLRLVDIRNGYFRGVISPEELIAQLMDRGYSLRDATLVSGQYKLERRDWLAARPATKTFLATGVGLAAVKEMLDAFNVDAGLQAEFIFWLRQRRKASQRAACVNAIKRRFMAWEIGVGMAADAMFNLDVEGVDITDLVQEWQCLRNAKHKAPTALMLCRWAERGVITYADLAERLRLLGYTPADSVRMANECQLRSRERSRKAQAAELRARQAAVEREARRRAGQQRQAETTAGRLSARALRLREKRERFEVSRGFAFGFGRKVSGRDEPTTRREINERIRRLVDDKGFTAPNAVAFVLEAIRQSKAAKEVDYLPRLDSLIGALPPATREARPPDQPASGGTVPRRPAGPGRRPAGPGRR